MTKKSYVAENGITLGLAGLALLVIFAIALPRWSHNGKDTSPINLPSSLAGGYQELTAANDAAESSQLQQYADAASTTATALGVPVATAVYSNKTTQSFVMATAVRQSGGNAYLSLSPGATVTMIGSDACVSATGQDPTTGAPTTSAICRRASDTMTMQVRGNLSAQDAAAALDEIWSKAS